MKIRNKINFSFLTIFILIAILIGLAVSSYSISVIKKNVYYYLNSNNEAKAESLNLYINSQKKMAVVLAAASVYRDLLKEPSFSEQYPAIKSKIEKRLARTMEADPQIFEVFIIDRNGKIIASSNKSNEGLDKSSDDYFTKAQGGVFLKDLYYSDSINKLTYAISSPVIDDNGDFLGVSVLRFLPESYLPIIDKGNTTNKTEENFLINREKFFISPSLFLGDKVILKNKVETQNSADCFDQAEVEYVSKFGYKDLEKLFNSQIVESQDYRNVDVVGTHSYLPETGWCLISKIDKSELLSFQISLIFIVIIIFICSFIIFWLLGYIIAKKITKPLAALQKGVEGVKNGNFDFKLDTSSQDEVGDLTSSFNAMSSEIENTQAEVEKKIKEQTNEIVSKAKYLEDQKSAILNILEDVEAEKNMTESLANDLEKYKLAVDNASDQVIITDREGIVIYSNAALERITGFKPEEALGKKAGCLWKMPMPLDYYQNMWNIIKTEKKVFIGSIQNKRKGGDLYDASISIAPVLDKENNIIYFVGIEHDITKEREIDKAKTEFVSLASHQLRTPLSAINWYTEMLLAGDAGKINKEQKQYLEEVAFGNQRMVDLVNSLLNVSRLDLGTFTIEPEILNITELSASVIKELTPQIIEKKLKVEEIYDKKIKDFNADKKLLRMVFQNLLSNAVKYTAEKGKVMVEVSIIAKGKIFGGQKLEQESMTIMVSDSGMGIPINQKEKIFSKLFRADNARESETEGTGLGLYIVKSIVDQSGGKIWFETEEKIGTKFYVTFLLSGMVKKEGSKQLD